MSSEKFISGPGDSGSKNIEKLPPLNPVRRLTRRGFVAGGAAALSVAALEGAGINPNPFEVVAGRAIKEEIRLLREKLEFADPDAESTGALEGRLEELSEDDPDDPFKELKEQASRFGRRLGETDSYTELKVLEQMKKTYDTMYQHVYVELLALEWAALSITLFQMLGVIERIQREKSQHEKINELVRHANKEESQSTSDGLETLRAEIEELNGKIAALREVENGEVSKTEFAELCNRVEQLTQLVSGIAMRVNEGNNQ